MTSDVAERPGLVEIERAAERLSDIVIRTPLVPLRDDEGHGRILLKVETHQPVGSFKIRGVFNAVAALSDDQRRRGISTVSAGNTAQALAWCGRYFGVRARSLMPEQAPRTKIDAVRALGGEPILVPREEVFRYLKEHGWKREPYAFIHPWIDHDVIVGHATMGLEIIDACPDVERVYVPVGGGGLMAGLASAIQARNPSVYVVSVEPAGCPSLHAALAAGAPREVECSTICDGVAVPYITEELFPLLRDLTDESILVTEDDVERTVRRLALDDKIVAEPAGALAVAAALMDRERGFAGTAVCPITGGSIDAERLAAILGLS